MNRLQQRAGLAAVVWLLTVGAGLACGVDLGAGTVTAVPDGQTVKLGDGRIVRLAGIQLPPDADSEAAARARLEARLSQQKVALRGASAASDRYGRTEAFIFLNHEGLDRSVQQVMVDEGLFRAAARYSDRACAAGFLASEAQARQMRRGLWADARWAVRAASDPQAIAVLRGEFALVEGRVLSVRESGGTIYVNFGRRRGEDFTVTVAKRNERALTAGGLNVRGLDRRQIRVRGWVEQRGGPWIEVTRPEQIELVRN